MCPCYLSSVDTFGPFALLVLFHSFVRPFIRSFSVQAHAVDYYYKHYDRISQAAAMSVPAAGNEISLSLTNREKPTERWDDSTPIPLIICPILSCLFMLAYLQHHHHHNDVHLHHQQQLPILIAMSFQVKCASVSSWPLLVLLNFILMWLSLFRHALQHDLVDFTLFYFTLHFETSLAEICMQIDFHFGPNVFLKPEDTHYQMYFWYLKLKSDFTSCMQRFLLSLLLTRIYNMHHEA